jgi:hypothetical protein
MSILDTLETLLARYELYEPELGQHMRRSPDLLALAMGRVQLSAYEATPLTYLRGPAQTRTYQHIVQAFGLPDAVRAALQKQEQPDRYNYYWNHDYSERVEGLQLDGSSLKLRYGNRKGRYLMEVTMPPLAGPQREAAARWLSRPATLSDLARATPLDPNTLDALALLPDWNECAVGVSPKGKEGLELGARFLCRALTAYPAYLLILRGLGGVESIRRCIETELGQRQADFDVAASALPAQAVDFWAATALPDIPPPHEITPGEGLGVHLPPTAFWPKPEANRLFMEALARTYKNIPRKLARLALPRRW